MRRDQVLNSGVRHLDEIAAETEPISAWKSFLLSYQFDEAYEHDPYIWLTCILALKAVSTSNLGIGCVLVDGAGGIVLTGHNQMFTPYFRSDRHAEMVVMDAFESKFRARATMSGFILYTSLEPCPMCLSRLIISGIPTVLYAAQDHYGGMVRQVKQLPPFFVQSSQRQSFEQARCSDKLAQAASDLFSLNLEVKKDELGSLWGNSNR